MILYNHSYTNNKQYYICMIKLYLITNDFINDKYSYMNYKNNCKDILYIPSIKKKLYTLSLNT